MIYLIISIAALIGGAILWIEFIEEYDWTFFLGIIGVIMAIYGIVSFTPGIGHSKLKDDMRLYEKASAEYRILNNNQTLPLSIVTDYKKDIDEINDIIDKSAKYHNHWYFSLFYYKEVGYLNKIPVENLPILNVTY